MGIYNRHVILKSRYFIKYEKCLLETFHFTLGRACTRYLIRVKLQVTQIAKYLVILCVKNFPKCNGSNIVLCSFVAIKIIEKQNLATLSV